MENGTDKRHQDKSGRKNGHVIIFERDFYTNTTLRRKLLKN